MKTIIATIALVLGFLLYSTSAAEIKDLVVTVTTPSDMSFGSVLKILSTLKAACVENLQLRTTPNAKTTDLSVTLTVDKYTSFGSIIEILDACKAAGVNTVRIANPTAEAVIKEDAPPTRQP